MLGVEPDDLDQRVRTALDSLMLERGFLRYSSHVAQVGRVRFIEIHILAPADLRVETVGAVDDNPPGSRRQAGGFMAANLAYRGLDRRS